MQEPANARSERVLAQASGRVDVDRLHRGAVLAAKRDDRRKVHDDIGACPSKIEDLTYKLCYTYYNVSGAIKEPAAIRYAHRLAALIGERAGRGGEASNSSC